VSETPSATPLVQPAQAPSRSGVRRTLFVVGLALVLLALVRSITGQTELTSTGTYGASLRLMVPILLAALGGLWAERTGVVNIGLEGMMILGTWFGAWAGYQWGPWPGVLLAVVGGAMGGLVHAIATVTFTVDQIVSGVAINILAGGVARFLSVLLFTGRGGGATQSPQITGEITHVNVWFLAGGRLGPWRTPDTMLWLENRHIFLLSDTAGLVHGLTSDVSLLTLIAVVLVPATWFFFWRTRLGLRMRTVGENPLGAESLGVAVYRMKYIGVVVSGALAGLAGAFLVLEAAGIYREGQTGGRGFIGLAAMIFGNWRPLGAAAGSGLFGYASALNLRSDPAVHALLLFAAIAVGLVALWALYRRKRSQTAVLLVMAGLVFWWWSSSKSVSGDFVYMTPYVTTLIVLAFASQRLRPPAADGRPYRKGQEQ
jgi:ABC-type uncharacterized transport system permease subunit